jgi:hypothetical protein
LPVPLIRVEPSLCPHALAVQKVSLKATRNFFGKNAVSYAVMVATFENE